jgi:PadR family transcriptional regulator, regulatory protein PadR
VYSAATGTLQRKVPVRYPPNMDTSTFGSQLRRGVIQFCVLALLDQREHYGFELVQTLSKQEGLLISEGTIYPLLSRLRRDGLVETEWRESSTGPPRKYYRLTRQGSVTLQQYRQQWHLFSEAVNYIVGDP